MAVLIFYHHLSCACHGYSAQVSRTVRAIVMLRQVADAGAQEHGEVSC